MHSFLTLKDCLTQTLSTFDILISQYFWKCSLYLAVRYQMPGLPHLTSHYFSVAFGSFVSSFQPLYVGVPQGLVLGVMLLSSTLLTPKVYQDQSVFWFQTHLSNCLTYRMDVQQAFQSKHVQNFDSQPAPSPGAPIFINDMVIPISMVIPIPRL